jgi:hypothetical protein
MQIDATGPSILVSRQIFQAGPFSTGKDWRYGCKILVWYEAHDTMIDAITREKQIKAGSRAKKLALIEALNPHWLDLFETLIKPPVIASEAKQSRTAKKVVIFWIASLRSQ